MKSIRYKYVLGQAVKFGNKIVKITEQREFMGKPSYLVEWLDKEGGIWKAVLKEDEIS